MKNFAAKKKIAAFELKYTKSLQDFKESIHSQVLDDISKCCQHLKPLAVSKESGLEQKATTIIKEAQHLMEKRKKL